MKFRASHRLPLFLYHARRGYLHSQHRCFNSFLQKFQRTTKARASINGGSGRSQSQSLLEHVVYLELQKLNVPVLFVCLVAEKIEEDKLK